MGDAVASRRWSKGLNGFDGGVAGEGLGSAEASRRAARALRALTAVVSVCAFAETKHSPCVPGASTFRLLADMCALQLCGEQSE